MRDPLVFPLVCVVAGILLGRLFGFTMQESAWPVFAFLTLAAVGRTPWSAADTLVGLRSYAKGRTRGADADVGARPTFYVCLALAMVFAGVFAEAWHRPGPPPEIDAGSKETLILAGCVVEPTVFSADREQFTLELDPGARARVSLALGDEDLPQRLDYGQRVEIEARIRRPHNYNNPASFDYAGYLARQNIYWTAGMTRGTSARILPGRCGSRFMGAVFALRVAALDRIERLYGQDNYSAGMMEAVLIGESSKLEKVWTENFRRTGTFHALVISGVHVTVLAGVLLFLLRLCALPELTALAITAAAAWLYALVSALSAPVVRAAGGFTLYLIARFFFRRGRVMNLLAAVALVYLLWDPGQMFDPSFQLSFLCVAAIAALASPILEATSAPLARGLRGIADKDADPHLEPRVAQFRVELRLVAETVFVWTRAPGIRRVDVIVATHAHEDHSGGLASLIENFKPRELWTGANPLPSLLARAARFHVRVVEMRAQAPFNFSGASIEVLSPPPGYAAAKPGNNDSLAFRIVYGARSFLLTGDMERLMEARLLADRRLAHADVLKVGHHGSKTSTTQPFLDCVSPTVAIISDGFENSFGHPHKDVITRLNARHAAVLRTDLDGLVTARTDGKRLAVDTMRWHGGSAWWTGERSFNWSLAGR